MAKSNVKQVRILVTYMVKDIIIQYTAFDVMAESDDTVAQVLWHFVMAFCHAVGCVDASLQRLKSIAVGSQQAE